MEKINKWLPIIFGCHKREDRSFYFKGKQFPVCARCTGELIGFFFFLLSSYFFTPSVIVSIAILIPMIIDGGVQLVTSYESNNMKRLITGILFGYGLCHLFVESTQFIFSIGYNYAKFISK